MKICIISGSSRKKNNTLRLAKATKNVLSKKGYEEVKILDFQEYDIPFFNGGSVDRNNPTEFQAKVFDSMSTADIVFIYSPEYNWFPSGEIVNFIHQLATTDNADLFSEKVFVMGGVSAGRGGKIPAVQLSYIVNKIINFLNLPSIVGSKIFESMFTPIELDEDGNHQGEESYKTEFEKFIDYSINLGLRWRNNS